MISINEQGWLEQAAHYPSPNHDQRPDDCDIDLLVIHSISLPPDEFGGPWVINFFNNTLDQNAHPYFQEIADLKVSSHLFIRRDGEIIQFVSLKDRAWHAGVSNFHGREKCNDFSIGIELEGSDHQRFTSEQYQSLADTSLALMRRYPQITTDRITGHSDISPGRKTDPGPYFDWEHYLNLIAKA